MFDEGKTYWFVLKPRRGFIDEFLSAKRIKGKVIDEDAVLVKIETDKGLHEIIPKTRIIDVNEARNTEFTGAQN